MEFLNINQTVQSAIRIAKGVGWEIGRQITYTETYQEFQFNTWYNYTERKIGKPNIYNEHLWKDFFENYRP